MPNKIVLSLLIVSLVVIVGCQKSTDVPKGEKAIIKIGVIAPLTGGGAMIGNGLVGGVQLGLQGLGDTDYRYELVVEDDAMDSKKSVAAAAKLINIDGVKALITTTSGTGNAVAPVAQEARVLHIGVCSDESVAKTGNYNFNNLTFPEIEAKKWVEVAKKKGLQKIAIIVFAHPGALVVAEATKAEAERQGLDLVFEEEFGPETSDFRTLLLKAQDTQPDIYLILAFPPALEQLGAAYKELDIKEPITASMASISVEPSLFENLWYIDAGAVSAGFVEKFEANLPNIKFLPRMTPFGHDALNMLVEAFENGKIEPVEYLNNLKVYNGVVGELKKTPDGRFDSEAGVWMIKDGKPVVVE